MLEDSDATVETGIVKISRAMAVSAGRIHTTVLEAMKSEEAMLKLQSITKLEPLSGVVGFELVVTQRRRRSPVCVVEPLTGGWRSNGDRRSPVCVVGGRLVAAVDRWLEVELNE
ncbi:hypothetical protein L2E82_01394 [Cichorium intybus]|uniref:Uncharacterized protein n=1 Tax=Cichorium intybus TaxID=13427 RepID=A0ACB9H0Y0_CICIN|nr:hypothetical protein L2E82_01394 [Cichorium intybus]